MMTFSERNYSSNKMSTISMVNDKVVHQDSFNDVQQSSSTNSALVTKRGFKPSDMFDPQKKEFLTNLSYKLFPEDFPEHRSPITVGDKEVDLNKIFTPAPDADDYLIKKDKTAFASSAFYDPGFHPTVKEQMELAKKISTSLSEPANKLSKGQSMYVNRKQRSVKWVHEGKGRNTSSQCVTPSPTPAHDSPYRPPSAMYNKQQQQPKYNTLPRVFPKPAPTVIPTNTLPRMEAYPNQQAPLTPLPDLYIPHTRLNDVYASPTSMKLQQWGGRNYNTAARGWGQTQAYYRPVTFDDVGRSTQLPYSDF